MLLPILLFDAYGLGIAQERDPEEGRTVTNLGRSPSEIKSSHQFRSSLVLITSWKWILIVNHLESIPPAQPVALTTVRYRNRFPSNVHSTVYFRALPIAS